jgi:hypothetical protein
MDASAGGDRVYLYEGIMLLDRLGRCSCSADLDRSQGESTVGAPGHICPSDRGRARYLDWIAALRFAHPCRAVSVGSAREPLGLIQHGPLLPARLVSGCAAGAGCGLPDSSTTGNCSPSHISFWRTRVSSFNPWSTPAASGPGPHSDCEATQIAPAPVHPSRNRLSAHQVNHQVLSGVHPRSEDRHLF